MSTATSAKHFYIVSLAAIPCGAHSFGMDSAFLGPTRFHGRHVTSPQHFAADDNPIWETDGDMDKVVSQIPAISSVQKFHQTLTTTMVGCGLVALGAMAARSGVGRRRRALGYNQHIAKRAFEGELGVQPPLGFFDPLGFTRDGDLENFKRRRETEIKHGRVCMLASIGYIVPEWYQWNGFLSPSANLKFQDIPNGLQALGRVSPEGWLQVVAMCGFCEIVWHQPGHPDEPGNYYKGQLGLTGRRMDNPENRKRSLNAEIANGRLAMMAIMGMFFQDGLTGAAWGDWGMYEASPLRAVSREIHRS